MSKSELEALHQIYRLYESSRFKIINGFSVINNKASNEYQKRVKNYKKWVKNKMRTNEFESSVVDCLF